MAVFVIDYDGMNMNEGYEGETLVFGEDMGDRILLCFSGMLARLR